jgi:ketosteroid isomerase-like protein
VRWVLVCLLACLLGCAAPPHMFTPSDDTAIRGVMAAQVEAWNRGDIDGFMAGYEKSPDLVFTSGGQIRHGYDETIAKYKAKYGTDKSTMGQLAFALLSIQHLGADGAIVLGKWALSGGPNAAGGVFSVAFERTSSGWRIVHDHTSSDPKPDEQH